MSDPRIEVKPQSIRYGQKGRTLDTKSVCENIEQTMKILREEMPDEPSETITRRKVIVCSSDDNDTWIEKRINEHLHDDWKVTHTEGLGSKMLLIWLERSDAGEREKRGSE